MSEAASAVSSSPDVVIAIVATDEAKNIVGCLGSLNGSIYHEFSVVICENGGHDASTATSANWPTVRDGRG